mmetsp:Transcript_14670/g.28044  ORF Transcript_14670/g.28044 Transcript_14670/m.28044 type:complete len:127 (-) Transcript_14670:773-1153(-)
MVRSQKAEANSNTEGTAEGGRGAAARGRRQRTMKISGAVNGENSVSSSSYGAVADAVTVGDNVFDIVKDDGGDKKFIYEYGWQQRKKESGGGFKTRGRGRERWGWWRDGKRRRRSLKRGGKGDDDK